MECCHIWVDVLVCYLNISDTPQKLMCRTDGPTFANSLEDLAHYWNVACPNTFYSYYFGRSSFSISLFLWEVNSFFRQSVWIFYVSRFFPCTTELCDSLPVDCFPLIFDLNGFKFRVYRHLLPLGSFQSGIPYAIYFGKFQKIKIMIPN